jgi:isopenicillin N synthase-like dioxygenase
MSPAIPVIDVEAAEAGDRAQLDAVRIAGQEFGAVQVVNHGVPQDLVADLNARMARLLGLPRAEKARLASPHPYRGWRQWPDDFGRLELERFNVAQFDDIEAARAAGLPEEYLGLFAHANLWPEDDPGLRDAALAYIEASRGLAARMLGLYAVAQGVPAGTFGLGTLPHLRLTVNDYPTWTYPETTSDTSELEGRGADWTEERGTSDEGRRRLNAPRKRAEDADKLLLLEHADDSAVTVLAQHGGYQGLQVQGPGGWTPVPVIPGALQVFSGHLLARWTGGRLRPGRHRVVAGGTVTRRSMAVFVYPALDAVVGPLPPFPDGPGAPPVLVWDHVKGRVADYLAEYGRPEQVAAWRDGRPYVAELAENSAGQ